MENMPNLIDIDSYCHELSVITNLSTSEIQRIVLKNFAKIYNDDEFDFTDATEKIEKDIENLLNEKANNPKMKIFIKAS